MGNPRGQDAWAQILAKGVGTLHRDPISAFYWFRKAAMQEEGEHAELLLFEYYQKGMPPVEQDLVMGRKLLMDIVSRPFESDAKTQAMCSLGMMYFHGEGGPIDYEKAYYCFLHAETEGEEKYSSYIRKCSNKLGWTRGGILGFFFPDDDNHLDDQDMLDYLPFATKMEPGDWDFSPVFLNNASAEDKEKVKHAYSEVENSDNIEAMYYLADIYHEGEIVPKDYGESCKWLGKILSIDPNNEQAKGLTANILAEEPLLKQLLIS